MKNTTQEEKKKKEKPKYSTWQNIAYTLKGVWAYDKFLIVYFAAFTFVSSVQPFIGIFFPKWILTEIMGAKRIEKIVMLLGAFFLSASIIGYLSSLLKSRYFPRMIDIRFQFLYKHFDKSMTTNFNNTEDPDFLNDKETAFRTMNSNSDGIEGILHNMFSFAGKMIALFGYIAIVSSLNVFVILYLVINVFATYFLTFAGRKYEYNQKDGISDADRRSKYLYNTMYDFSYGKEIRLLGVSDLISRMFMVYKNKRLGIHKKIQLRYFRYGVIDIILLLLREAVVYSYLIYLVVDGGLSIPDFTMYFTTISGFATWFTGMIYDVAFIRSQSLTICDYRKYVEFNEGSKIEKTVKIPSGPYEFEFKNVSFKYPKSDKYIYKELSFIIPAGQKLAVVGHNGAGKTTFIKLLCRLYDVEEGEILLNGININRFDKSEYYKMFSAVFQEVKMMAFSIAENIALTEDIDYKLVDEVLETVGIAKKVSTLEHGSKTSMFKVLDDEGVEFSGGENQKLSIARALYKDGDIMLLDEPTAALDALAEYEIYRSFNKMVKNKTAIYISHRLASTRFCDVIAMIEHGKLVEYGTHDELLEKNGKYADMFETQAKYYKDEEVVEA